MTANTRDEKPLRPSSIMEPLRVALFRRIWLASLLSNLGLLIQGVGAAWAMTQFGTSAEMVALVQTALMLPILLLSIGSGALADMYDRRKVGLFALAVSLVGASLLTLMTAIDLLSPWLLLGFCFAIGTGMALFGPAWQASVAEQVPAHSLPQAVALNSISYNIARSFGPAIGGIIVASAGAVAAFTLNAILYIPLFLVLFLWRRTHVPPRLPPERIDRAMASGLRYAFHSPAIRIVLGRTFVTGFAGGSVPALMPLVARDALDGTAETYGLILGAFGIGAVLGALNISRVRHRINTEMAVSISALVMAVGSLTIGLSSNLALTAAFLVATGAAWMVSITLFNISIQLSAPRWVAGRTLAAFQAAIAGGIAVGSWLWGRITEASDLSTALTASAVVMALTPLLGFWLRMPEVEGAAPEGEDRDAPEIHLALTPRSGPIVVEVEYLVQPEEARSFYGAMQKVGRCRNRNGAYSWSLSRDISNPVIWTERFHCPTWMDYLRHLNRYTASEVAVLADAEAFHRGEGRMHVRRMLERPFGSVRWKEDAPDQPSGEILPLL